MFQFNPSSFRQKGRSERQRELVDNYERIARRPVVDASPAVHTFAIIIPVIRTEGANINNKLMILATG